ncbi:MAG: outer membrane beta-barrel protein [Bacteroidaceae bacterium]|nr:outer membrane beta-barrel protein [Bacteroidaceae bacterium]
MKRFSLFIVAIVITQLSMAQVVTGKVFDKTSNESVISATVSLLKTDSSLVSGTTTDYNGAFSLKAKKGSYILRISYVGYKSYYRPLNISGDMNVGTISLATNSVMLKAAEIAGVAKKVVLKEDTFIYNADAYRVPEGSVLEELVKKIPGAEVSSDGAVKVNGKDVKKILVDGKEFMTGDTKTAMKNIPTSVIEKIKSYDEKSDLTKVTGIDDGEEQTVLDIGLKKGADVSKGYMGNVDFGIGTEDRYAGRAMGGWFQPGLRVMGIGSLNNVNDRGFSSRGGDFGGNSGDHYSKMAAVNMNYEKKDVIKVDGSVRWNHSDGDMWSKNSTQNFVGDNMSYSNSINQRFSRSNSWNGQARIEWTPDTMTNILFRPSFTYSSSDGTTQDMSATFDHDPYEYAPEGGGDNPLEEQYKKHLKDLGYLVNDKINKSISYSDNKSLRGTLQLNRKLNNEGRNVTLRLTGTTGSGDNKSISLSDVGLYHTKKDASGQYVDSLYSNNRYNLTPAKNWDYSMQATYSEPIFKKTYLQFSYTFQHSFKQNDRSTYDFSDERFRDLGLMDIPLQYRNWADYIDRIQMVAPLDSLLSANLSKFTQYHDYTHTLRLMFRMVRDNFNLNAGVVFTPQKTEFTYRYQNVDTVINRNVFNWSPQINFRYKFSKVSQMRIQYNGASSEPSMTDMIPITDDSNPLNITKGNPGLKPSFSHYVRLFFNDYITSHNQAIMANVNFNTTQNSVSNMVTYDPATGGRTSMPMNINGNWSANGGFMYNASIDSVGTWNVNTFTNIGYNNYVSYYTKDKYSDPQKNTTRSTNIGERLAGSYRNSWLEVELNGTLNYNHSRNMLQENNNMDTWQFSYGGSIQATAPWGTAISTSLNQNSRRGYNDAAMNTNELLWNAQISHSFLKGKPLTVRLQFYDLLHQQSNISRSINALMRSDTETNGINSYVMLRASFRFTAFGNKKTREIIQSVVPGGIDGVIPPPNGGRRPSDSGMRGGGMRGGFGGPR